MLQGGGEREKGGRGMRMGRKRKSEKREKEVIRECSYTLISKF